MGIQLSKYIDPLIEKVVVSGPRILFLIILFVALYYIIKFILKKSKNIIKERIEKKSKFPDESIKRIETLFSIFSKIVYILLVGIAFTIILGALGINIAPILTAAGIFGLAVSFGAQNLVRDIISGVFILVENQVRKGDVAIVNGVGGFVESINLRTIVLRDFSGIVHIFPNGVINTLSNMTKDWSAMVFDIGVAYKEDPDKVITVIKDVAEELRNDEMYKDFFIEPMQIFGVDNFDDSAVVIKARLKTIPGKQWDLGREFRKRLKKAFDDNGIEIPFPHRSVYFGEASKPIQVSVTNKS
ncbi:MAG: mechanosensitive ion channel family protein [Candidatus Helarchaeota archaeon]|nr:mechanosensitive ion channel family protein [Candidatus Helarchaeota archaeon]